MTNPSPLRLAADNLWDEIAKRHPEDEDIPLLRNMERKLAGTFSNESSASSGKVAKKEDAKKNSQPEPDDLDKIIYDVSIRLFKNAIKEPAFASIMADEVKKSDEMRYSNLTLATDARAASGKIANVYRNNPKIFKQHPSPGKNAAARWHLQPGV